jgi:RHS repeat-associated protein
MCAIVPWDVGSYSYAGMGYANPHAVTSVGGTTYTYDNNGNVTAIGSLDYTWDWRNRLASAERNGGGTTSYGYDHTGQRVFQATGSATTSYPNRYYNVASSSLAATTTKHIFSTDGTLLATVVSSGTSTASTTYLHPDHLGGTNVATDENAEVVQTLDYYPYGSQRIATGSFAEQRRFIGEEYDGDTEFSYLNARYYQGSRGQFMSQDPVFVNLGVDKRSKTLLADPQLQNSYGYARDNPIIFKDAMGEIAFLAVPAAPVVWGWIATGFTGMAIINTFESAYTNFWLPARYPLAYSPEQKQEAPFRFLVESALDWGSAGATQEGGVLLDSILLGGEYVPDARKRTLEEERQQSRVEITGNSGGGSAGSAYNYIYQKPFGPTGRDKSSPGRSGRSGFSAAQEGAILDFANLAKAPNTDVHSFISALQAVLNAFDIK